MFWMLRRKRSTNAKRYSIIRTVCNTTLTGALAANGMCGIQSNKWGLVGLVQRCTFISFVVMCLCISIRPSIRLSGAANVWKLSEPSHYLNVCLTCASLHAVYLLTQTLNSQTGKRHTTFTQSPIVVAVLRAERVHCHRVVDATLISIISIVPPPRRCW